jgi:hypothetical protein
MATAVFALCAVTSITAALLLLRGFVRSRTRLLLWASLGFLGLAANNVILFVDKVVAPDVDLTLLRNSTGLAGLALILYGFVEERS